MKTKSLVDVILIILAVLFLFFYVNTGESFATFGTGIVLGVLVVARLYRQGNPKSGEQMNF